MEIPVPTSAEIRITRAQKADEHAAFLAQFKTADDYDMPTDKVTIPTLKRYGCKRS